MRRFRFFKDAAVPTQDEDSGGAVSCIRVFSGELTAAEVAAIGASPTCSAPTTVSAPASPTPTKKCKKHKKKHRAAEAKKKKCKKEEALS